ncbi:MAG TPA: hypothetical protein VK386_09245 [Acidimicrobiales bacterium]|nr:hypothetical protein [Acidimicrobiales bacterium]
MTSAVVQGEPPHAHVVAHGDTSEQRHNREHIALWLFIAGDAVLLLLSVFAWIYTRALDTKGMWRGAACTVANPCQDGLGNPLTHEVRTADPWYGVGVLALAVAGALLLLSSERAARRRVPAVSAGAASISAPAAAAVLVLCGAIALQLYQFTVLPFTTIDGTYASFFEFFMGSASAHLVVVLFVAAGAWNRARLGRYAEGQWYQLRLVRIFALWIAFSIAVLLFVMSVFT